MIKDSIYKCIANIDYWLYKKLGIVTSLRKAYWTRKANEIQHQLNDAHTRRDYANMVMGTNYTTKRALIEYKHYYLVGD